MKKNYTIITAALIMSTAFDYVCVQAKSQKKIEQAEKERYQQPPQLFQAEHGLTGQYWCQYQNLPARVFIDQEEFINIVVLKKKKLHTKKSKKLRHGKDYLGTYTSPLTYQEYNIYGNSKNPEPLDDGPDADVLTVMAIKQDYGIGE